MLINHLNIVTDLQKLQIPSKYSDSLLVENLRVYCMFRDGQIFTTYPLYIPLQILRGNCNKENWDKQSAMG